MEKYLIEKVNVKEGEQADPPHEMAGDDLTPFTPPSSEFANNTPTFESTTVQQKLLDKDIEEEEKPQKSYKKLLVMKLIAKMMIVMKMTKILRN